MHQELSLVLKPDLPSLSGERLFLYVIRTKSGAQVEQIDTMKSNICIYQIKKENYRGIKRWE